MALILGSDYFDAVYDANDDPWSFASRWYEARKYAVILACLPAQRYERAFEPGCSVGVLSKGLAKRCDAVLSTDISNKAVDLARRTVPGNVTVELRPIPEKWPGGTFDLVVLSDVGHYFDRDGLLEVFGRARDSLTEGGTLVASHWRHPVPEYPSDGDDVHAVLEEVEGLISMVEHIEVDFRLSVRIRGAGPDLRHRSVAAAEGWLDS